MKSNRPKPNSRFRSFQDGEFVILCEETAHLPRGASRREWNEDRVAITLPELRELAKKYLGAEFETKKETTT